jgi:toxin FitB
VDPVAVDTDVASLLIKRKLPTDMVRILAGRPLVLTFVTLGELTRWVEQRQWGPHRRELLDRWLIGKHVLQPAPGAPSPPTPAVEAAHDRPTTRG